MSSLEMMMSMLPPGVAQLYDALPPLEVLDRVSDRLSNEMKGDADSEAVGKFLAMLAQVLKSQGIVAESKEQTEPLRMECGICHMSFAVDNAYQYRRRIEEGFIYACANEHEPHPLGTGRLGELSPDEQQTFDNEPNIRVVYPADYVSENDNPSL